MWWTSWGCDICRGELGAWALGEVDEDFEVQNYREALGVLLGQLHADGLSRIWAQDIDWVWMLEGE